MFNDVKIVLKPVFNSQTQSMALVYNNSCVSQETVSPIMLDQSGVAQETGPIVSPLLLETMAYQSGVTQETGPIASPLLLETMED